MQSLMLCKHKETKRKLIIKAFSKRIDPKHWFGYADCCVDCGCEVK
jgi:hypothetical protein